jgi:GMP synthase (glutamine-hydrolysing)
MKPIAIIKTGYTDATLLKNSGDFEQWIMGSAGLKPSQCLVINAQLQPEYPNFNQLSGVIITGSHDNVTDAKPWMKPLAKWLKSLPDKETPTLGICFGHQILASVLGGQVDYHPGGGEYGLIKVDIDSSKVPDGFFIQLPEFFYAFAAHGQTVNKLPPGAISFGFNSHDTNHLVQFTPLVWGCQFHPEFSSGTAMHYSRNQNGAITKPARLMRQAEQTGCRFLKGFVALCKNRG